MNPLLQRRYSMVGDTSVPTPPASPFTVFIFGMGVGALVGLFTMKVAGLI